MRWGKRKRLVEDLEREIELRDAVNRGLESDTISQLRFHHKFSGQVLVRHAGAGGWVRYSSLEAAVHAIKNRDEDGI